jgi:hypothetical protein
VPDPDLIGDFAIIAARCTTVGNASESNLLPGTVGITHPSPILLSAQG